MAVRTTGSEEARSTRRINQLQLAGGRGDGLRIEIVNDVGTVSSEDVVPGAGVGLAGLRERVEVAGGTFDHHTDDAGQHHLHAWLPWPA